MSQRPLRTRTRKRLTFAVTLLAIGLAGYRNTSCIFGPHPEEAANSLSASDTRPHTGTDSLIDTVTTVSSVTLTRVRVRVKSGDPAPTLLLTDPPTIPNDNAVRLDDSVDDNGVVHSLESRIRFVPPSDDSAISVVIASCTLDAPGPLGPDLIHGIFAPFCSVIFDITWQVSTVPPDTGTPSIVVHAVRSAAGVSPGVSGTVSVDCPGFVNVMLDEGEPPARLALTNEGQCSANLTFSAFFPENGPQTNAITLLIVPDTTVCESAADCEDPEMPFCGGFCHDGGEGTACDFDPDCAEGLYCGPMLGCVDGSTGDACDVDSDCTSGSCSMATCS